MGKCFQSGIFSGATHSTSVCVRVCACGDVDVKLYNHKGEGEGPGDMVDRTLDSDWLPQQSDFRQGGACVRSTAPFTDINSLFRMTRNLRYPHGSAAIGHWQKRCNLIQNNNTDNKGLISIYYPGNYFKFFKSCPQNENILKF